MALIDAFLALDDSIATAEGVKELRQMKEGKFRNFVISINFYFRKCILIHAVRICKHMLEKEMKKKKKKSTTFQTSSTACYSGQLISSSNAISVSEQSVELSAAEIPDEGAKVFQFLSFHNTHLFITCALIRNINIKL